MISSEEELRERLLGYQHSQLRTIGIMFMLCPPYLVGLGLFVLAPSMDRFHIMLVFLGGWLATISFWMSFVNRYVMKRLYPELFERLKQKKLVEYMGKLKLNMAATKK